MKRETPLIAFAAGLALLSVVMTGGPRAAAEARRDQARADDLRALANLSECQDHDGLCSETEARGQDPFTGAAYEERQDPRRWCAVMERSDDPAYGVTAEGCVLVRSRTP